MPTQTPLQYIQSVVNPDFQPDAKELLGAQEEMDLMATSRASRMETAQNSAKLDANIAKTTSVAPTTPTDPTNPNQETIYVDQNFADSHDMNNPAFKNYKVGTKNATVAPEKVDPYAKALSDYSTSLEQSSADRATKDAEWQTRLDNTQKALVASIEKKYEARRLKMEDINKRMLEGKRIAGISAGRQRYASSMEEGLLSTEEMDGQARLAEIDAEEMSLIAQAKQARDEQGYKAFNDAMNRVDALSKEKLDTITKLHQLSIDQDKAIEQKRKDALAEQQSTLNLQQDQATSYARSAYEIMKTLGTEKEKEAYLQALAKGKAIDPEILRSAIREYSDKEETQNSQIAAREQNISIAEQRVALEAQRVELAKQKKEAGDDKLPTVSVAVGNSVQYFKDMMKEKGWKGINPEEYQKIADALRKNYGGNAVLELDKAIEDADLEVDQGK